jgi:hypothetical protein
MKSGSEDLNGAGTFVSEKVHLDEIAVILDSRCKTKKAGPRWVRIAAFVS